MPYLSSILNSEPRRLLALVAIFALPLLAAEFALVPWMSGRYLEVAGIQAESERPGEKTLLLLGDSTAARLRWIAPAQSRWLNLGLGGASIAEWRLQTEQRLALNPSVREVVVMATGTNFDNSASFAAGSYIPYIATWRDLWRLRKEGHLTTAEALRLGFQHTFLTNASRSELVYGLFSASPALRPWADQLLYGRHGGQTWGVEPVRVRDWRNRCYAELAELAQTHHARLTLVVSPVSSAARAQPTHQAGLAAFHEACAAGAVRCLDLQQEFPDQDYAPEDPIHVRDKLNGEVLELLERKLGTRP